MPPKKRRVSVAFPDLPQDEISATPSWRDGLHSDWVLLLGSQSFRVHKVVVGMGERRSLLLAAAFRKPCEEVARTDLTDLLPTACHAVFEDLLDYLYGKDLVPNVSNWAPLMKIADVLQVPALHRFCVDACDGLLEAGGAMELCASAAQYCLQEDIQVQITQAAADVIAPKFSSACDQDERSYKDMLVAMANQCAELTSKHVWVLQFLVEVLSSDQLQVDSEDDVFNFVREVVTGNANCEVQFTQLWQCCRLQHLSHAKLLEAVNVDCISKETVVRAALYKGHEVDQIGVAVENASAETRGPRFTYAAQTTTGTKVNSIRLRITNLRQYAQGAFVSSEWRRIGEGFIFRLKVYPSGTTSTGEPRQLAAFVEVRPSPAKDQWELQVIKYAIVAINSQKTKSQIKSDGFTFTHDSVDRGFHRGFVKCSDMNLANGWVDEHDRVNVEAILTLPAYTM